MCRDYSAERPAAPRWSLFFDVPLSSHLCLLTVPLVSISAPPKPGTRKESGTFSRGPVFYCDDFAPLTLWFSSDLGVEINHSHLVTSACTLYCPSVPLVPKITRPPSQRPASETVKFVRTPFIFRSHPSRSLCSTFPFLTEGVR